MENMVVLRLVLLFGFLAFSQCEEERVFRIRIDTSNVYRNAYYADKSSVTLYCLPPKEKSDSIYDEVAIFRGNGTKGSERQICKGQSNGCKLTTGSEPSLSFEIKENGQYKCQYVKQPEPAVKEESVHVYFKQDEGMKVLDQNGQTVSTVNLQVTNDTHYSLLCPEAGQTETKVHWYRNEHELKLDHGHAYYELNSTNQNLTFKPIKNPDGSKFGGWYRCERLSKDGGLLKSAFVKVNSHAFAAAASKSYNKMEGESATLSCDIEGEPVPSVRWKRGDKILGSDPEDSKRITFSSYKGIPNATITIKELTAEDYGEYVCIADAPDGSHAEAPILLRVRSKLAALWPFLGIVAEVIILVAIIFIYEKRRAKKEQEENEDTADQKKSLTASNNENKDVRQRKA